MAHQPSPGGFRPPDDAMLFRELFESSPDGILIVDRAPFRIIFFNAAACHQLGCAHDEFARLAITDHEAFESLAEIERHVAALQPGSEVEFNISQRNHIGEVRDLQVSVRPLTFQGKPAFCALMRDITSRVRAEEALRQHIELLARSQRVAHVGHWSADLRTGAGLWSDELRRIYGVGPDTPATFEAFVSLLHADDRAQLRAWVAEVLAGRQPGSLQFRVVRPDGSERFIEGDGNAQFDESGRPVTMFGTAVDITGQRRAMAAVADSEAKFRTLFEAAQDAIFVMNQEVFVDCNRQTEVLFGLRKSEIIGRSPLDLSPRLQPDGRPSEESAAERIAAALAGRPQLFWWVHLRRDGTPFDAEVSLNRVDVQGQPFLQAIVRDITDRRRAERSLRLQSAALNAAGDAIVITDREGVIEWVNPAFAELTGYMPAEAIGRTPGELVGSGKHPEEFFREFWGTISAGQVWRGEFTNKTRDGRFYTESQSVTPIRDGSGAISHFVAIKEDITERLRLEAQFQQAQKMESIGLLASGIAHDFNNLLTVINGLTELMIEQSKDDAWRDDLNEIRSAGEKAASLTRQLLAFSRQQILVPRILDVGEVVVGVKKLLERLLGEDIALIVTIGTSISPVKADPGQLEQVIINLAVNARDAMPNGGRLEIDVRDVDLLVEREMAFGRAVPPGRYVRLSVRDTGEGMEPAVLAQVFEPFFTTKDPGKGTGLGLSTVYGIVLQSSGFIAVESERGGGATFSIYLPTTAALPASEREAAALSDVGTETIMVVEDNAGLGVLARRFLERAGYSVLTATSGAKALALLEDLTAPVDLVLTDVVMPGMSGRELADAVKRRVPTTKILYMSGYTADTVLRHGVSDAVTAFINKPFTSQDLLAKVRETLDRP